MRKKFKTACGIACALGFLVMLCAAMGSDANTLTLGQSFAMAMVGLGLFAGAGYLGGIIQ